MVLLIFELYMWYFYNNLIAINVINIELSRHD